jgi:hypothetical protein
MQENMITRFSIWKDLNLSAEFVGLLCNQRADAIYGGFIVRRRFRFHKKLKK